MIEEVAGIDTCVPWRAEDMCNWIFCYWHHTFHDTCPHVDRGRSHSTRYDKMVQNRSGEEVPWKKLIVVSHILCALSLAFVHTRKHHIISIKPIRRFKKSADKIKKRQYLLQTTKFLLSPPLISVGLQLFFPDICIRTIATDVSGYLNWKFN